MDNSINKSQIIIGLAALCIGTLVYLVDRSPSNTYFVQNAPMNISLFKTLPNVFDVVGRNLPSFAHVFAFVMITSGLIATRRKGYIIICLSWMCIDWIFELGQRFYNVAVALTPDRFDLLPFFENTKAYFRKGTFDWVDMLLIFLGGVVAYFVLILTMPKKRRMNSEFTVA